MVLRGTYSAYYHEHVKLTARHTFYVCTLIQQVIQFGAFLMSTVILIAIRRVLKRRPKCQTGLCTGPLEATEPSTPTTPQSSSDIDI